MLIDVKTFFHNIHYSVPWTTGRRSANLGRSGTATYIKRKYNFSQWKSYLPLVLYRKNRKKITPTRSSPTTEGQVQLNWSNSGSGQARGLEVRAGECFSQPPSRLGPRFLKTNQHHSNQSRNYQCILIVSCFNRCCRVPRLSSRVPPLIEQWTQTIQFKPVISNQSIKPLNLNQSIQFVQFKTNHSIQHSIQHQWFWATLSHFGSCLPHLCTCQEHFWAPLSHFLAL